MQATIRYRHAQQQLQTVADVRLMTAGRTTIIALPASVLEELAGLGFEPDEVTYSSTEVLEGTRFYTEVTAYGPLGDARVKVTQTSSPKFWQVEFENDSTCTVKVDSEVVIDLGDVDTWEAAGLLAAAAHRVWRRGRQVRLVVDKGGERGEVCEWRTGFDAEAVAVAAFKDSQWPVHEVYVDGMRVG